MVSLTPRSVILAASRNRRVERFVAGAPVSRGVVRRFVAGESAEDAVRASRELTARGLTVSLDHLGEDTTDVGQADATVKAYLVLLDRLSEAGLTAGGRTEVSVKLSAVGANGGWSYTRTTVPRTASVLLGVRMVASCSCPPASMP